MNAADASALDVLVVEDDSSLTELLCERLGREGFRVRSASTAAEAQAALEERAFDVILLDVGLPDASGFEIAPQLRRLHPEASLIFLTAYSAPEDRVHGLELGAEDYVAKPFHMRELLLRIRNAHKRAARLADVVRSRSGPIRIGRARVDLARFELEADGERRTLTHKECSVLRLLIERDGEVVSRDEMLDSAWSHDEFPTPRTVDNFILRLRRLIEPDPDRPSAILSVRGVGYRLVRTAGQVRAAEQAHAEERQP